MTNDQQKLKQITVEALTKVFHDHIRLGKEGVKEYRKNQFGEICLEGDWRAEEEVIRTLKDHKVPIKIISEEHGVINLGEEFLGVLDGLDGTSNYIRFVNGDATARYGTMFGIYRSSDPFYRDYLVSTIIEHPTRKLFLASKKKGVHVFDMQTGEKFALRSPERKISKQRALIDIDKRYAHYEFLHGYVRKLPRNFQFRNLDSDAAHYTALITGNADLLFECTRKRNLEIAVGYGLVTEWNGVMVTLDEEDIGTKKYLEFGQQEYVPVISAANVGLARDFIRQIR